MELFLNRFFSNIPVVKPFRQNMGSSPSIGLQSPDKDTFIKSQEPVFMGRKGSGSTKKGSVLKDLDNITCPYSGVKMLSAKKLEKIESKLTKCKNISEQIDILEQYRPCMQKNEKHMFTIFKGYAINNPDGTMNDCLEMLYPEALAELKIEQIKILDNVDRLSNKMDAKTALEVRKITTNARHKILNDDPNAHMRNPNARTEDHIFKRKDLLMDLRDATINTTNKELFDEMWNVASKLPKSSTSIDAFIVKYTDRSPLEIAARLLRPSTASIEHITPANPSSDDIKAGENELTNFMLVSRDWNSGRSNMPLDEFVKKHRNIPRYSQRHINDIMHAIKKGKLTDCDWYPYVLKEKLYNESKGLININIDRYHISEEDAFINASDDVLSVYSALKESNKSIK